MKFSASFKSTWMDSQPKRKKFNYNNFNRRGKNQSWHKRGQVRRNAILNVHDDQIAVPQQQTLNHYVETLCPYKGWTLYFPREGYNPESVVAKNVATIIKYLDDTKQIDKSNDDIQKRSSVLINTSKLLLNEAIQESWPNLPDEMHNSPESVIAIVGLAIHHLLTKELEAKSFDQIEQSVIPFVFPRFVQYEPITALKELNASCFGKLISIKGTVVRASKVAPVGTEMAFKCHNCADVQVISLPEGKFIFPPKCLTLECRGTKFVPVLSCTSNLTKIVDWQMIRIQELLLDDQKDSGRIPRTVDCELTHDLVDSCVPGDIVIITGIVNKSVDAQCGRRNADKCVFLLNVQVNSVTNCKGNKYQANNESATPYGQQFTRQDLYTIESIQAKNNLFRSIIASICPTIYGHEIMKAGLVLSLFGGTQKYSQDNNRVPVRGDPHVLVVGDPGLGKSQVLQSCANVIPRGVYVSGNTSSVAGLTVTVCKGSSDSESVLEAGALVLADQGCCCIDEFDKMTTQRQALLEAMEQQSISIAKAGIICSLPARTSILAAANPIGGHYNRAKTVADNLKMSGALLSRFDLVFILLDKPNENLDCLLSKHVMAMHSGQNVTPTQFHPSYQSSSQSQASDLRECLMKRLRPDKRQLDEQIPHSSLRKYIGYARTYIHPKITPEAAKVLQEFYLKLRKERHSADGTPITTRQLESLTRLTEARAKVELREKTTEDDARDVIDIMRCSLMDAYTDDRNTLSLNRSQHGSGMSGRSKTKKFIAQLSKIANETSECLFTVDEMKTVAKNMNIQGVDFQDFLQSLNNQNYLLKKGPRLYKLLAAGF